jgi:hypothetical protein
LNRSGTPANAAPGRIPAQRHAIRPAAIGVRRTSAATTGPVDSHAS